MNIKFPETNLVECVFCYRQSSASASAAWDEFDRTPVDEHRKLKRYMYYVPEYLQGKLSIGDTVVVHCVTGYQLAQVVATNAISAHKERSFAPVIAQVDMAPWISEVGRQKTLVAMKQRIDAEKRRLESMVTYELIAEKNPEFKALLEQFKELGGEF